MNKEQFLRALRHGLYGLRSEDIDKSVDFYNELIDDYIEDGLSSEDAVAKLGDIDIIIQNIKSECNYDSGTMVESSPSSNDTKPSCPIKRLETWQIVVLCVTAPIWASLLIAAVSVCFGLVMAGFAIILSIGVVAIVLPIGGIMHLGYAIIGGGGAAQIIFALGVLLASIGLAILIGIGFFLLCKLLIKLCKKLVINIKDYVDKRRNRI